MLQYITLENAKRYHSDCAINGERTGRLLCSEVVGEEGLDSEWLDCCQSRHQSQSDCSAQTTCLESLRCKLRDQWSQSCTCDRGCHIDEVGTTPDAEEQNNNYSHCIIRIVCVVVMYHVHVQLFQLCILMDQSIIDISLSIPALQLLYTEHTIIHV